MNLFRKFSRALSVAAIASSAFSSIAHAETVTATKDAPVTNRFGIYGTFLGDPGFNSMGLNLVYKITDQFRPSIGVGTLGGWGTSYGAGFQYLLPSNGPFCAFLGGGVTYLHLRDLDEGYTFDFGFQELNVVYPNVKLGIQYNDPKGLFAAAQISGIYLSALKIPILVPIPSLSLGVFF